MRAQVDLEVEKPGTVKRILEPSLENNRKVSYSLETGSQALSIEVETERLGPLRGCTDTVFRLSSLATKIYSN